MKLIISLIFLLSSSLAFAQPIGYYLPKEYQSQNLQKKKRTVIRRPKLRSPRSRRAKLRKDSTPTASITATNTKPAFRKYTEKLSFNYFTQFLGPSLSSDYQPGATYNRFKTGQDYKGDALDSTASHQMFHSITMGYQISKNISASFGYTFQEDLNSDIKYKSKNEDGSYSEFTRFKGVSDNNKRFNLFVGNIYANRYITINANHFFEFASTFNSEGNDMNYGLGFQPSVNFNTGIKGFYTGVTSSIQRNYFKRQEFYQKCGDTDCRYPTRYQTLLAELGAFANYSLNDYVMLKSSVAFDWDKRGDQVETFGEFNQNMDDVGRIGIDVIVDYGVTAGTFLEFGLEQASLSRSAIGATLNVNLF